MVTKVFRKLASDHQDTAFQLSRCSRCLFNNKQAKLVVVPLIEENEEVILPDLEFSLRTVNLVDFQRRKVGGGGCGINYYL